MIADAFRVVLEAEVDDSKLNRAGSKFGKHFGESFEKYTEGLEKMFKPGLKSGIGAKGIPTKDTNNLGNNLGDALTKNSIATQKMGAGMTGKLGKILAMVTKFIPIIAIIAVIGGILSTLAPIIGLLKLIVAMIQLTLYPIAQFFLTIFKPILYLLLKYLIIPFYQTVLPVMQKFDKWLTDTFGVGEDGPSETGQRVLDWGILGPLPGILKLIKKLTIKTFEVILKSTKSFFKWFEPKWEEFKVILIKKLQSTIDWVNNIWSDITDFMESPLQNIINWVDSTWQNIKESIEDPLQNIINWVNSTWQYIKESITNPLKSVFDFISKIKLPSWLGGGSSGGGGSYKPPTSKPPTGDSYRPPTGDSYRPPTAPPGMQEGGIVMHPSTVKVAEREPEIIIPLRKLERVKLPSDISKGNTTINFNIQKIEKDVDMNYLLDKLQTLLYSNNKRSGAF